MGGKLGMPVNYIIAHEGFGGCHVRVMQPLQWRQVGRITVTSHERSCDFKAMKTRLCATFVKQRMTKLSKLRITGPLIDESTGHLCHDVIMLCCFNNIRVIHTHRMRSMEAHCDITVCGHTETRRLSE